jgi:hypothetical protein
VTRPGAPGLADDLARFDREAVALAEDYRQLLGRVRDLCGGDAVPRRCQQAVALLVTMFESQDLMGRLLRETVTAVVSEAAGAAAGGGGHDGPA